MELDTSRGDMPGIVEVDSTHYPPEVLGSYILRFAHGCSGVGGQIYAAYDQERIGNVGQIVDERHVTAINVPVQTSLPLGVK